MMLGGVALAAMGADRGMEPHEISNSQTLDSWIRVLAPLEDSLVSGIGSGVDLERVLGPDPFLIAPAPSSSGGAWVILLRGSDDIALLDERFEITHRLPAPPGPDSWAWVDSNLVVVSGEGSGALALYQLSPELRELQRIETSTRGIRGVAFDPESRTGFALDPLGDRAFGFQVEQEKPATAHPLGAASGWRFSRRPELDLALPAGPLHAVFVNGSLITNSLLAHTVTVHRRTDDGWTADASVTLDGPLWSIDVSARGDTIWIAAGGIEDRPLDRTGGEFGNIDSYLYLYRYVETLERAGQWNVSERGVVTPKRVHFYDDTIWVSGFGGERVIRIPVRERSEPPELSLRCPPGITDFVIDREHERLVAVSPLLDVVAALPLPVLPSHAPSMTVPQMTVPHTAPPMTAPPMTAPPMTVPKMNVPKMNVPKMTVPPMTLPQTAPPMAAPPIPAPPTSAVRSSAAAVLQPEEPAPYELTSLRSTPLPVLQADRAALAELELGELLVFTTLLTPGNRAEGDLSRFSCEACHYEGGVDGRTHFTGRDHVFATTKPIRGLAQNVPLFSRAGSELLCDMVPAEFAVANQGRSDRNWISAADHPWMRSTSLPAELSPETQRRGMLRYMFELPVIPHPSRAHAWTSQEEEGLRVFRDRCSSCHLPIRTTRDETSRAPFEEWAEALSSPDSDLIWGAPFLIKTGITPYVSPAGARVPSLRRLAWKRPYFTDGSARTIEEVLDRFRYRRGMGWHETTLEAESLTPAERAALLALLRRF